MNKVDQFIEGFISETRLFFLTNLLIVIYPNKFSRIAYVRSKREKFIIQNKYLFFFVTCFIFFVIQTLLEINLIDVYNYLFTNRLYFIDYKQFITHIRNNISTYQFKITEIFFFIFPIGFIPLIAAWCITKFIGDDKHYNYLLYIISFQINVFSISILIYAGSFLVLGTPFNDTPYIMAGISFSILYIYTIYILVKFIKIHYANLPHLTLLAVFIVFSVGPFILSESIMYKNELNKFINEKSPPQVKLYVMNHPAGRIRLMRSN